MNYAEAKYRLFELLTNAGCDAVRAHVVSISDNYDLAVVREKVASQLTDSEYVMMLDLFDNYRHHGSYGDKSYVDWRVHDWWKQQ